MAKDSWRTVTVSELAAPKKNAIVGGPFGSNLVSADYVRDGVPVIRGQNMGSGRWVEGQFAFVTPKKAEELSANLARPGDLVFTQRGTLGQVALVPQGGFERYVVSQSQMKLSADETKVNPLFVYYYFSSQEQVEYIRSNAIQTGVPHTNLGILKATKVRLPTLEEQCAIASILGSLDDKIELNRRMNQTLEAMARAIFKSWFVDFDPVRDGAAMFPGDFEDSDLGKIPKGWSVGALGDHAEILRGLSYKGSELTDSGLPLHNLNSVLEGGGYKYSGIKYYAGEFRDRHTVTPGDVIVANTEQGHEFRLIGYPAIVPKALGARGLFSHHLFRLRPLPNSGVQRGFLYLLLLSQAFRERLVGYASGTTVNMLPIEGLSRNRFVVPPPGIVALFERTVSPFLEKMESCYEESKVLANIRDALLPKLVSGGLRL